MEYKNISLNFEKEFAKIILKRPPLNILNIEMLNEIRGAIGEARKNNEIKGIVISADGKAFSAGVDIFEHTKPMVKEMINTFHLLFDELEKAEVPTISLVNGIALGGGCELALACDFVLASESSKFGLPEIKVGVFPPIASALFPRIVNRKKAFEFILTGETISAKEAETIGIINHVYPDDKFAEETEKFMQKISANSSAVLRLTKASIYEHIDKSYDFALAKAEELYLNVLMETEDANEGLKAFIEKRKPVWKNR
ncbi:MAG: enoyl-CoA hydratase/isomerase family protein [Candidatus Thermoplasmatota archaeon]